MTLKSRFGPFPKPQQHGAWAMFLIPAAMSAWVAGEWRWSSLFLILSFVLIFLSHRPAVRFMRRKKFRKVEEWQSLNWVLLLAGSGIIIAGLIFLSARQWSAMILGGIVAVTMLLHLRLTLNREHMSVPGEIIGVAGLTATAPVIYLFQHGVMDALGWVLWMVNFLYFAGSIFYIKLKVRYQPRSEEPNISGKLKAGLPALTYSILVVIYLLVITVIRGYSWYFLMAYLPSVAKVLTGIFQWQSKANLKVSRYGFVELTHAILFGILTILGFVSTTS